MKVLIECTPGEVTEMLKSFNINTISIFLKENADNAMKEQNRLNSEKLDIDKICSIINKGIKEMFT